MSPRPPPGARNSAARWSWRRWSWGTAWSSRISPTRTAACSPCSARNRGTERPTREHARPAPRDHPDTIGPTRGGRPIGNRAPASLIAVGEDPDPFGEPPRGGNGGGPDRRGPPPAAVLKHERNHRGRRGRPPLLTTPKPAGCRSPQRGSPAAGTALANPHRKQLDVNGDRSPCPGSSPLSLSPSWP